MKGNVLTRYRVIVLNFKPKKFAEDAIFISEGDIFYGYSYKNHKEDKFFDLWFTDVKGKTEDSKNFVTFGRIKSIASASQVTGMMSTAQLFVTKLGQFLVEEVGLATNQETFYGDTTDEDIFS